MHQHNINKTDNMEQRGYSVTIITVCFNSEKTISRTIESLLNQTFQNFEYIIVDGASTDNTLNIIKSFEDVFKKKGITYRLISEPDKGIYDAMNKGIKMAKGSLIGIVNSDDWYEPDAIATMLHKHTEAPENVLYGILKMYHSEKVYHIKQHTHDFLHANMPQHPTWFVPKKLYDQYGTFDTSLKISADYELANRFKNKGVRFTRIEKIITNFTIGGASHNSKTGAIESLMVKHKYGFIDQLTLDTRITRVKYEEKINQFIWNKVYFFFRVKHYIRRRLFPSKL